MYQKNKDPIVVIGGAPRVVGQVRQAKKRGNIKDGMNVGDILDASRAGRLLSKEHEKLTMDTLQKLATGKLMNKVVTLPNANWRSGEFGKVKGAYEIARDIELDYANQAAELAATQHF